MALRVAVESVMRKRIHRVLLGVATVVVGGGVSMVVAAVVYTDVTRWNAEHAPTRSADRNTVWIDQRWWMSPYSHLQLRGVTWTESPVFIVKTGETVVTATAQRDGYEYWSVWVLPPVAGQIALTQPESAPVAGE